MALIENIISSSIERKHIIRDKPLIGDIRVMNLIFHMRTQQVYLRVKIDFKTKI